MLLSQPDRLGALAESLETSLLGCALTMSVLQEQIGGLAQETEEGELKPKKFKYVLEQDYLKELLQQIRGQQISITLLLQTYQRYEKVSYHQSGRARECLPARTTAHYQHIHQHAQAWPAAQTIAIKLTLLNSQ